MFVVRALTAAGRSAANVRPGQAFAPGGEGAGGAPPMEKYVSKQAAFVRLRQLEQQTAAIVMRNADEVHSMMQAVNDRATFERMRR